jgi:DNA-binding transcriptional regulator YhcF (GntR family)
MRTAEANHPRTPSVQIADDLRSRIESREFARGAKLPSIRDLATQHGVASTTAQGALQRLRDERRVYTSGRGHFVGEPGNSPSFAERVREVEAEVRELRSRIEARESAQ